jgi:hypothetical protein
VELNNQNPGVQVNGQGTTTVALNKQNPRVQVNGQATTIVALNNQNLGMQTQFITLFGFGICLCWKKHLD